MKPTYIGKVRDVYDLGDKLILCSTDRISAFDVVFPETIPEKGKILNQISNLWFKYFQAVPNHILETNLEKFPQEYQLEEFRDRAVLVKKCKRIDFECVVRGYLSGSAYKEYKATGQIAGVTYPSRLEESSSLVEPIFTPAIKNDMGHDVNVSEDFMKDKVGIEVFQKLKDTSLYLYLEAKKKLESIGILLCDTKFEFGIYNGEILLIDELLTPDSSRYWDKNSYKIGSTPASYDKQILRNYLESISWNKTPPTPPLPNWLIQKLIDKNKELQRNLEKCLLEKLTSH